MKRHAAIMCLPLAVGFVADSRASDWQFHGFLSQTAVMSEDNPFFTKEAGTSLDFREAAINASWQVNDRMRFAGQLLSRKAGFLEDGDPEIDFLLLDATLWAEEYHHLGARLGRVKNPYGLYNATRDVPHARPGVFVPQSIYFETYRDALLSLDGVDLYLSSASAFGDFSFDVFAGKTEMETSAAEYQLFQKDIPGQFDDVDVLGLRAELHPGALDELALAVTVVDISMALEDAQQLSPFDIYQGALRLAQNPRAFSDYITGIEIDSILDLYSAQYVSGPWTLTGEFLRIHTDTNIDILSQQTSRRHNISTAYYLQAEWMATDSISVYSRYEAFYFDKDDKDGSEFSERTGASPITQYGEAVTAGARWYLNNHFSATLEYSHNKGVAFLTGQEVEDYGDFEENWDLLMLQFSFHF